MNENILEQACELIKDVTFLVKKHKHLGDDAAFRLIYPILLETTLTRPAKVSLVELAELLFQFLETHLQERKLDIPKKIEDILDRHENMGLICKKDLQMEA